MEPQSSLYLGFDPGGDRRFGVAVLDADRITASTVSSVNDAVKWVTEACGLRKPIAAGIDTLLHWATTRTGLRPSVATHTV